uniref:Subtilisin n=1 Tax=Panagrolaimus sp. ES5 TaxID=591445 RepID=A0AC34GCA3_9BILA
MDNDESVINYYIPKDATEQNEFVKKYPQYDGRGIIMAIIDGGIDNSLPGMQYTTTGIPKILDCFDFTSGIKIDTSAVFQAERMNNIVIGLSGRKLKVC